MHLSVQVSLKVGCFIHSHCCSRHVRPQACRINKACEAGEYQGLQVQRTTGKHEPCDCVCRRAPSNFFRAAVSFPEATPT